LLEAAVPGLLIAAVNPDNTPHGYNWTFAFPMLLFIVIALILYALFSRPHRRVPGRPISATASGTRAAGMTATPPHGAHVTASATPAQETDAAETPADDSDSPADDGGATGARE
jgi:hypothetical protein